MKFSQQPTKKILRALERELRYKVTPARKLVELGWRDFCAADHPDSANVVIVACEAFLYLSLNSDTGNWNEESNVLMAINTYLLGATGRLAQLSDYTRLKQILEEHPVKQEKIRDWFQDVYN